MLFSYTVDKCCPPGYHLCAAMLAFAAFGSYDQRGVPVLRRLLLLAALGLAFALSACETSTPAATPAAAPTVQVTVPPAPADVAPVAPTDGATAYPYPAP